METWWTELICAVIDEALDKVKRIISEYDLRHSAEWPSNDVRYSTSDLLYHAISTKHTEIVEELLKCGLPVNGRSKCGFTTPLHMAVEIEDIKIVEMLLERSADIFAEHNSQNPLEVAVERKNVKIAELLLNRVAHINSPPNRERQVYGCEPIFSACYGQSDELVELFLRKGSAILINSTEKTELLGLACYIKRPSLVKLLMKYGADIDGEARGTTALETAVNGENLAIVECILEFCPDISRCMRILHRALEGWRSEGRNLIVDVLLRYGFNVRPEDAVDGELLKFAIECGRLDIVKTLLKYGAEVNASCECLQGSTFLHVAAENRRFEIAKILIQHGADVNMKRSDWPIAPIYAAVHHLDVDISRLFLSSGAIIDDMLHLLTRAFQINGMKMVEFLLQQDTKFDINAILATGETVLLKLIYSPFFWNEYCDDVTEEPFEIENAHKAEIAELCLRRGATVDLKSPYGDTALCAAIWTNLSQVVKKLLKYGADVDTKYDAYGNRTPLMIAVKEDSLNMVRILIRSRPNSEIRDWYGKTALHYAVKCASPSIVQELLNYGADINATSKNNTTPYSCGAATAANRAVLELHMDIRKAQNRCVNSKNLEQFNLQGGLYDDFKREIEEMKRSKISDSIVSFYDILSKGAQNLVNYMRNENIVSSLKKKDVYEKEFPVYFAMIHHRFVKSINLEALMTLGAQSIDSLIGFHLPDIASMHLLGYLSIKDLKKLIKASPTTD